MKKLMMLMLAVILMAGFSSQSFGQIKIGANAGIGLPMGDFGDGYKMGFGGSVEGKYFLNDKIAVGASIGYYSFTLKDEMLTILQSFSESITDSKYTVMPILATVDYYFATEGFKPYVGAGVGLYSAKIKVSDSKLGDGEETSSDMGIAPTVGFCYGLSEKIDLNVNAKYNMIFTEGSSTTYLGINAGIIVAL